MTMVSLSEKEARLEQLLPLIREYLSEGKSVRFSPRGTSMLPLLRQGRDSVVLSAAPEKLRKYDIPLYRRDDGTFVLHRIVQTGETYTCAGDNQFVLEPGIRRDQIIAVVTAVSRENREYTVDSWGSRLYCRLWHGSRPVRRFWRRGMGWLRRRLM